MRTFLARVVEERYFLNEGNKEGYTIRKDYELRITDCVKKEYARESVINFDLPLLPA